MEIAEDTRLTVPTQVLSRAAAGETVLLDVKAERYFALEGAAGRLWDLVSAEGGTTFAQAVAALLDEFEVDVDTLSVDARRTLVTLVDKGLVTLG